jgi:hypothetical protein
LNREFPAASGVRISTQTVRNRLHASGLHARKPAVRPALTARHRNCRLQFARRHANWGVRRIRPLLFTDESRFCLDFHDGRRRVWRQKKERFKNCCVAEHDRFVNEYLQQETIERMDLPAKSLDLNLIEHAWNILQRRISNRQK